MVEQAAICSVPIEFVAMRGSIKLLSFIAKEARNAGMLIPVLGVTANDGYEGAIVLIPDVICIEIIQ